MAGCEIVMHLGAQIAIPYSYRNPRDFFETNALDALNVAQAALEHGVDRLRPRAPHRARPHPGGREGLDTDYTHLVHLAAIVGVASVVERPLAVLRDNVRALETVVAWGRGLPALARLVFASTSEGRRK